MMLNNNIFQINNYIQIISNLCHYYAQYWVKQLREILKDVTSLLYGAIDICPKIEELNTRI